MQSKKKIYYSVPEGFELKSLRKEHVKKINDAWISKFKNSEKFLEDLIEFNPSMGLYDSDGELLAWNMR
jgi:hypothetical protein